MDQVKNFVKVIVSGTYNSTDTEITLATGHGAKLPDPASGEFDLVWWNSTKYPDPADDPYVEVVRCMSKGGDGISVLRGQQNLSASIKQGTGQYKMILTTTAGFLIALASEFAASDHNHSGTYEPAFSKGTAFNKNFGTTSGTTCQGNDSRLSNPRPPSAHAANHLTGGSDAIPLVVAGGAAGLMSGSDKTKLDNAATASASSLLDLIKTVDGPDSALDADTLDGQQGAYYEPAFTKNTAFNTNFGAEAGTVCSGADARLLAAVEHMLQFNNPHNVTAEQIGAIDRDEMGTPYGVATLGADGRVLAAQINSINILTYNQKDALEAANAPSATNALLTKADITELDGGLHI